SHLDLYQLAALTTSVYLLAECLSGRFAAVTTLTWRFTANPGDVAPFSDASCVTVPRHERRCETGARGCCCPALSNPTPAQLHHWPRPSRQQVDQQNDQCDHQQNVDESAQRVGAHHTERPQNEQDDEDGPEHGCAPEGVGERPSALPGRATTGRHVAAFEV